MPKLAMSVPHSLGQEAAVERLKDQFKSIKEEYADQISDLSEEWNGNLLSFGFTTYGVKIKGTVTVDPAEVAVAANLPIVAMMFKGPIEQQLRDQLTKMLS